MDAMKLCSLCRAMKPRADFNRCRAAPVERMRDKRDKT
jgi:hypothetical protein